jgi:simple sugar transport system permease protein
MQLDIIKNRRILAGLMPILALLIAFLIGAGMILLIGQDPIDIYGRMISMTLGNDYGLGQVLFRATPLILTGLAVAIPFKAGLFNIGGEGQAMLGAFACGVVGFMLPEGTPSLLSILLCLCGAMLAGGAWGFLAGWLRTRYGINEVISTIMLNFIAAAVVGYVLLNHVAVSASVHTPEIVESAHILRLDALGELFPRSPVNLSLLLSLGIALLFYALVYRSKYGYELRAVGKNPHAATYAGIDVTFHQNLSMAISGALAGLVSANLILGYKHYFELGITGGLGFLGIAVAMLASNNPLWIILSALLFGWLDYGGLTINAYVPKEVFLILQATVILFIIGTQKRFKF